jgi:hypothetical protein
MDFMNKVFSGEEDDGVHVQFVRFGKGIFQDRGMINLMRTSQIKVSASFEYVGDFLFLISEILPEVNVSGIVLSKEQVPSLSGGKKKAGMFEYELNKKINSKEIKELLRTCYSVLLDVSNDNIKFKCKKKLPKPGKGEGKVDDKFCQMQASPELWSKLKAYFFSYAPDSVKKVKTKYIVNVEDIILPKDEKDFERIRIMAKRKGKIKRISEIDKQERIDEIEFCI